MSLYLYNTLTKKKESFEPLEKGKVKMYTCGPTVYDYASIGNMWSYLTADILRRYLEYLGYEVRQIKNITDVGHFTEDEGLAVSGEDKLEKAAKREKRNPLEIADQYIEAFLRDEKSLNIKPPHFQPRPTKEVPEIIKIIEDLIEKGFAYETDDGVYFSVDKFRKYGQLSGNTPEEMRAGARIEVNENKKNPLDFALWIKRVGPNAKHILHWESPWGLGFPGWHIECTAMATKYLGDSLDIHTGGEDNIFPHHECELAQSEAYTGKPLAKYWIHTRHFQVEGQKMSKSLENVYTVTKTPDGRYPSLEEKGYAPLVFRTLKLGAHYRTKANLTWEGLDQAKKNWERINDFYKRLATLEEDENKKTLPLKQYREDFEVAMNDDLNTPEAMAVVLKMVKEGNQLIDERQLGNPQKTRKLLKRLDEVLGILREETAMVPAEVQQLGEARQKAREAKDFEKADELRGQIEAQGFEILDQDQGFEIKKK